MNQKSEIKDQAQETRAEPHISGGTWKEFFAGLLEEGRMDLLLVPQEVSSRRVVVQTLVREPSGLKSPNPCAPLLMSNSARLVSDLTFRNVDKKIGVVLRSCEIRAVVELAKLKQVNMENLYIIGVDCPGTFEYKDFVKILEGEGDIASLTKRFVQGELDPGDIRIRDACRMCIYPVPENVHHRIRLVENAPALIEKRKEEREKVLQETGRRIGSVSGMIGELSGCRLCYNCRRACPICYCRECIFSTLTFEHDPHQYLRWASRKGVIKMPTDTLLFQITRMNHMITSCVSCGQCSSACPNDIPVAEIFATIGSDVQGVFEYIPGRSIEDELPIATFKEEEFQPR